MKNSSSSRTVFFRAIRIHQWSKNILVFVPLIMAHKVSDVLLLRNAIWAFLSFSFSASGAYIINDLLDRKTDMNHPLKKFRPFASGELPVAWGFALFFLFQIVGFAWAIMLPPFFMLVLVIYLITSLGYSFYFKKVLLVDVMILAGLYTLRIIGGGLAVNLSISPWLLAFSMFIFLSLAFVKRFSELYNLRHADNRYDTGRAYLTKDLELIAGLGAASGYISVLVLALYINGKEVVILYSRPYLLWLICPLLVYWISRLWLLANRELLHEDPIIFAIKDKTSYLVGVLTAMLLWLAI